MSKWRNTTPHTSLVILRHHNITLVYIFSDIQLGLQHLLESQEHGRQNGADLFICSFLRTISAFRNPTCQLVHVNTDRVHRFYMCLPTFCCRKQKLLKVADEEIESDDKKAKAREGKTLPVVANWTND